MKTTQSATYRTLLMNINRSNERLNTLRMQASDGKRVRKPSDDPAAIRPILNARTEITMSERYLLTLGTAGDDLSNSETQYDYVGNRLIRAKEIAIAANNAAMSPQDLAMYRNEIQGIMGELRDTANSVVDGKYIFSGFSEKTVPFVDNPNYPATETNPYLYQGDDGAFNVEIAPGERIQTNVPGDELFLGLKDTDGDGVQEQVGVDIFAMLGKLERALGAGDTAAINTSIDEMEVSADQVRKVRSTSGLLAARVDTAKGHMQDTKFDMQEILSRYEDVDLVESLSALAQESVAFEAALKVSASISDVSIFKYF